MCMNPERIPPPIRIPLWKFGSITEFKSLKSGGGDSSHCVNPERIPPPTPLKPPGAAIAKWGRRAFRTGTEIISNFRNSRIKKSKKGAGGRRLPRLEAAPGARVSRPAPGRTSWLFSALITDAQAAEAQHWSCQESDSRSSRQHSFLASEEVRTT